MLWTRLGLLATVILEALAAWLICRRIGCELRLRWAWVLAVWPLIRSLAWMACWFPWPVVFRRSGECGGACSVATLRRRIMKPGMIPWTTMWFVIGFVAFQVNGSLCLRMAAERTGVGALAFFAAGNVIGFCGTVFLTLALPRSESERHLLALSGLGFCVLQLAAYFLFRVPLSPLQWFGVSLIAGGVVCLQFRG